MPKFFVEVQWMMTKTMEYEANSLEDAIDQARNDLPTDGQYLDDSFEVNEEITAELNKSR